MGVCSYIYPCVCVGVYHQASFAFNVLEEALRLVLEKMEDLSSLAAETARLAGLLAALRAADVDAGGDGTVIGFGSPPKNTTTTTTSSSSSAATSSSNGLNSSTDHSSAETDFLVPKDSSIYHPDVELTVLPGGGAALLQRGSSFAHLVGVYGSGGVGEAAAGAAGGSGVGSGRQSRVLRLMDGSEAGLSVEGLSACVPGRHHEATVVCRDLSFKLTPGKT